jgi:hypothetical protein
MPAVTENYNLIYSLEGEILFADIEATRYNIIDRQLFGLFKILGNGVITGWEVSEGVGLTVNVSPGSGVINFRYHETTNPYSVLNLPPNTTGYIFAEEATGNPTNIIPTFVFSRTLEIEQLDSNRYILLSQVTTGADNVSDIDNSVIDEIDFVEAALELVRNHKHTGGSNPSQIDLERHVRGKLPNENVGDLDASKVTSGRLSPAVIPQLNHFELDNVGTLTHPQIDAYIKMLTFDNTHLFGEVAGTNLLQLYMAHKHIWADIDQYTVNFLGISPGISPDEFTDFDATNAELDDVNHVIRGVLAESGSILNKNYYRNDDFKGYESQVNTIIENNSVFLDKSADTELVLLDFEDGILTGDEVPGFVKDISSITDNTSFTFDDSDPNSGVYAGNLDVADVIQLSYTNTLTASSDLTDYTELHIAIKTISFNFVDIYNNDTRVLEISVLSDGEVTDGYKNVITDISTIDRDAINKVVIRTDTSMGWDLFEEFSVSFDDIKAVGQGVFYESGTIRYIVELPVVAQWEALSWLVDLNGGAFKIRGRSATTRDELANTPFSPYVQNSGDSPDVPKNPIFEFEITLESTADGSATPVLDSFRVTYIVAASDNGFAIDTYEEWARGTYTDKTDIETTPGSVRIKSPISIGNIFYGNSFILQEIDLTNTPVTGFRGHNFLLSPNKVVLNDLEPAFDMINSLTRADEAVYRFCDTGNDRIMEITFDGRFVYGLGSFNETSPFLGVMSVVYNPRLEILQIVFSRGVLLEGLDLSKIELRYDGQVSLLDTNSSVVEDSTISSDGTVKLLKIQLSSQINEALSDASEIGLVLREGFFIFEELSDFFLSTNLVRFTGFPVFKGDFLYIDGLFQPVSVNKTKEGNYLIGNAKRWGRSNEGIATIVEFTTEGIPTFSYDRNSFQFTLETLGNAKQFNDDYIVAAGISGTPSYTLTADNNIESTVITAGQGQSEFVIQLGKDFRLKVETFDKEENKVFGDRYVWTSDNNVVAEVDVDGTVTARTIGEATITATAVPKGDQEIEGESTEEGEEGQISESFTGLPRTATARIRVDSDPQTNYSVSTVLFTDTENDIAGVVENPDEEQPQERNATGYVYLIGRASQNVVFTYVCPEGSYPAKVTFDQDNNLFIAEKSFLVKNQGRVIKVDFNGNILFEYGFGEFDSPNDVQTLLNNEIIVSS